MAEATAKFKRWNVGHDGCPERRSGAVGAKRDRKRASASRRGSCQNTDGGANWLACLLPKLGSWHPWLWAICGPRVAAIFWSIAIPAVAITAQSWMSAICQIIPQSSH